MWPTLLSWWLARSRLASPKGLPRRRAFRRPQLEALEDRTFADSFASTSDPDVFGPFTLC
jgi:hypothetical protein